MSDPVSPAEDKEKSDLREIEKVWLENIYAKNRENAATGSNPPQGANGNADDSPEKNKKESLFRNQAPSTSAGAGEGEALAPSPGSGGDDETAVDNEGRSDLGLGNGVNSQEGGGSIWDLLSRLVFMMILVLGGFYVLFRFLRKKTSLGFSSRHDLLTVIASINLPHPQANGKLLQIVDLAGALLLIAVSDSGIRLISKITEKETVDHIRLWQSQNQSGTSLTSGASLRKTLGNFFSQNEREKSWKLPFWDWQQGDEKKKLQFQADFLEMATSGSGGGSGVGAASTPAAAKAPTSSPATSTSGPPSTSNPRSAARAPIVKPTPAPAPTPAPTMNNNAAAAGKPAAREAIPGQSDDAVIPGRLAALLMEQRRRLSKMGQQRDEFTENLLKHQQDFHFDDRK